MVFANFPGNYTAANVKTWNTWSGAAWDAVQDQYREDGIAVTATTWVAQQIQMGSGVPNITRSSLYLVGGTDYWVSAYTDNSNNPGTLINSARFRAEYTGYWFVPTWIGSHFNKWWLVIRADSGTGQIGTSAPNTDRYPAGKFKVSSNSGSTWTEQARDLWFRTYIRQ